MSFKPPFEIGAVVSNGQLSDAFGVGNMGGMRRSKKTGTLVLISDNTKGLYSDKWENGILHYTGMGKIGDQSIEKTQNKTLAQSETNGVEVHLFEVHERAKYTYTGVVELSGKPFQETQPDDNGNPRKVWIFPLRKVSELKTNDSSPEKDNTGLVSVPAAPTDETGVKEQSIVYHKVYGMGTVTRIEDERIYVEFENNQNRIFEFPAAFEKGYLKL